MDALSQLLMIFFRRMKNGVNSEIYMSILENIETIHSVSNYEISNTIFKWNEQLFSVFQNIETSGAQKITPFIIGDNNFLVVANYRNNKGMYCPIYTAFYIVKKTFF